jgi:prepilin-type N-terminal cleavage/methylation domain-containing protein
MIDKEMQVAGAGRSSPKGFSLIETMIAIVVLSVGVLGLAAMLASNLTFMGSSQYDYIAQQKAAEAVESIFTARDLGQATWSTICNVGSSVCTGGIFVVGAQPLCDGGADQILGTADDYNGTACAGQADAIILPGSSGTYNSSPTRVILSTTYGFRRTITISAVTGVSNLRQITVLVTYSTGKYQGQYTLNTTISNFS